jgi:hypothetical protein
MADKISPKLHAEIIVVLFDEYQDLHEVTDRVGILLSDASAEHVEAVGKYLPVDLMRVPPRGCCVRRSTIREGAGPRTTVFVTEPGMSPLDFEIFRGGLASI